VVETFDDISEKTKKRLVRDSRGEWHTLEQSVEVLFAFDLLVGLRSFEEDEAFDPNFDKSREIIDEALAESERSGLPLDLCFQNVVLRLDDERISEKVRKKLEDKER
jgi:hypothetical protein